MYRLADPSRQEALGRVDESLDAWRTAKGVPVADPEDLAIVEADFADAPV